MTNARVFPVAILQRRSPPPPRLELASSLPNELNNLPPTRIIRPNKPLQLNVFSYAATLVLLIPRPRWLSGRGRGTNEIISLGNGLKEEAGATVFSRPPVGQAWIWGGGQKVLF